MTFFLQLKRCSRKSMDIRAKSVDRRIPRIFCGQRLFSYINAQIPKSSMIHAAIDESVTGRRPLGDADELVCSGRDDVVENSIVGVRNSPPQVDLAWGPCRWRNDQPVRLIKQMRWIDCGQDRPMPNRFGGSNAAFAVASPVLLRGRRGPVPHSSYTERWESDPPRPPATPVG